MAIAIPKFNAPATISTDVGGVGQVDIAGRTIGEAMARTGALGTQIGTELLRKRKQMQTQTFLANSTQAYLTERQDKMQELETKFAGTDGTGYYQELQEWDSEARERLGTNSPNFDAKHDFDIKMTELSTGTLLKGDERELSIFIESSVKNSTKMREDSGRIIVEHVGPALDTTEDLMINIVEDLNSKEDILGMSPKWRKEQEEKAGVELTDAYLKQSVRELDIAGASTMLGTDFLSDPSMESLVAAIDKTGGKGAAEMLKKLRKQATGGEVSPLAQYVTPAKKEFYIRQFLKQAKAASKAKKANFTIQLQDMKVKLQNTGSNIPPATRRDS